MEARFSRGDKRTWPNSGPPTYSMNPPSSSLRATRTSSSSSTDSVRRVLASGSGNGSSYQIGGIRGARSRLTIEEGDELIAGALGAQGKGDGREAVDGIEAKQDIIVLGKLSAWHGGVRDAS